MTRPCFLIIDREYPASISTRKLVVETAKYNVLTAYSPDEAVDTLRRFPAVNAVVMDVDAQQIPCDELIARLRTVRPGVAVVTVAPGGSGPCREQNEHVDSHNPQQLVEVLSRLCPEEALAQERHEARLLRMPGRTDFSER